MECTFCQIAAKKLPANIVYEDDKVIAIVPLNEVSKGHILLLPKEHFENIFDVEEDLFQYFSTVLISLAKTLVVKNQATGLNILNANGQDAQQSVMHLHFHLVPRYPIDNLDLWIKQEL